MIAMDCALMRPSVCGVRVQEDKKEFTSGGTGSVLKLVLLSSEGDASASATVLHGNSPRLLTYDGIDIEAPLQGTLVAIRNHDVPGVVGRIGTILGEHEVNIANFALGRGVDARPRRVPQGQALAVVQIEVAEASAATTAITALKQVEAIAGVRLVELG
jgi:D-3-phosphoglycerate dehydrogenase